MLYVRGSSEDPARGAHSAFIDQLTDVADDVYGFPHTPTAEELKAWYRRSRP